MFIPGLVDPPNLGFWPLRVLLVGKFAMEMTVSPFVIFYPIFGPIFTV